MVDEFDRAAVEQKIRMLNAEEQNYWSDYANAKANGDHAAAGEAAEAAMSMRNRKSAIISNYNQMLAAEQPQQPRYVSDEQRAARTPGELDAYDLAKISGITPEKYMEQFQKLASYKATRGSESK